MEILINLLKQEFLVKNKYEKVFYIFNLINFIDNFNFYPLPIFLWISNRMLRLP